MIVKTTLYVEHSRYGYCKLMYEVIVKLRNFKVLKFPGLALMLCSCTLYLLLSNLEFYLSVFI